jgi:hypothetical protein
MLQNPKTPQNKKKTKRVNEERDGDETNKK